MTNNLARPAEPTLAQELGDRWKALHMSGDEALGRVAMDARADIRLLFGEKGSSPMGDAGGP